MVELHDGTIRGSAAARQFDDPAYDAQLTEDRTTFFDNDVEQSYVPLCVPPPSVLPP
ncbi:MAG: hypothetical protein M5U28_05795 [Sandaracinaceae bacterium]|nr:hypothetical protein [Sandaracinaceae bacterium]